MIKTIRNISILAGIFLLASGMASKVKLTERDFSLQLTYEGRTRDYILHTPPNYQAAQKMPLVLVLHGGGGKAEGMFKLTHNRFNELADQNGFFVVYPQGLGKSWNEGAKDSKGYAREHQINDAGFLSTLIDTLAKKYPIDLKRVFSTGISNGGLMSFRLGCEMSEKIRAIAPVAANIPEDIVGLCEEPKTSAVGLLLMNGTEDPIVPYGGGNIKVFGQTRGKVISADQTVKIWLKKNGCTDTPKSGIFPDKNAEDGTRVRTFIYDQCTSGVPVELYQVQGGGHTWPGGMQYLRERRIGKTSSDINATDEIWKFFSSFK